MRKDIDPETALFVSIQHYGLLFRRADFIQLGYSRKQYKNACRKLLAAGLIKRLGKGQYVVAGDFLTAVTAQKIGINTPD